MGITDHFDHISDIVNKAKQARTDIAICDELLIAVRGYRGAAHPVTVAGKTVNVPSPALVECLTKARTVAVTHLEQAMNAAPKESDPTVTINERPRRK